MTHALEALQEAHLALASEGTCWLEMRPRDPELSVYDGDHDFLVPPSHLTEAVTTLLEHFRDRSVTVELEQRAPFKRKLIAEEPVGSGKRLTIELWTAVEITHPGGGTSHLDANEIFCAITNTNYAQRPAIPALIYLTHLEHKRKELDHQEVIYRLGHFHHQAAGCTATTDLLKRIAEGTIDRGTAASEALVLLRRYGVAPVPSWRHNIARRGRRLQERWLRRRRRTVPVVGPDGSGKSSLIQMVCTRTDSDRGWVHLVYKHLYRRGFDYKLLKRAMGEKRGVPKNRIDERLLPYVLIKTRLGWPLLQWRLTLGRKRGLMDRFFWDYCLPGLRYPTGEEHQTEAWSRHWGVLAPTPGAVVVAGCPDATLRHRKAELSTDSVHRLYRYYYQQILYRRVPRTLLVSTDQPVETAAARLDRFLGQR